MSDKIYDRVWKLLSDQSRWTKGALSRDCYGSPIFSVIEAGYMESFVAACRSPEAVSWCVIGAIWKVYGYDYPEKYYQLSRRVFNLSAWNDHDTTHEELISVLKELDL
jgi:hypothetical protein